MRGGLRAAHDASGSMGRRAVPLLVAFADADQTAVAHIDRDQELFSGLGGNSPLAEEHLFRIDVVVDGREFIDLRQTHAAQDHVGDRLAVERGKALRDVHIVDVILKQFPFHIGEIFGDAFHALAVQLFERRADLPLPSRGAVLGDQRVDPLLRAAAQGKLSLLLIVRADLRAEIAAAGVDNKIQCAVLGAVALDLNSIKITFESFPVLLGALLFGPLDGLAVGFVGTLLYQLLRYGVSATTLLWILPYALAGLVTGFYAKRRGFSLTTGQTVGIVVAAEVLITALNTLVMYIDAKLYGYWFPGFISAMLLPRGAVCIVKAVVFGLVLPKLCARVRRALPGEGGKTHGA